MHPRMRGGLCACDASLSAAVLLRPCIQQAGMRGSTSHGQRHQAHTRQQRCAPGSSTRQQHLAAAPGSSTRQQHQAAAPGTECCASSGTTRRHAPAPGPCTSPCTSPCTIPCTSPCTSPCTRPCTSPCTRPCTRPATHQPARLPLQQLRSRAGAHDEVDGAISEAEHAQVQVVGRARVAPLPARRSVPVVVVPVGRVRADHGGWRTPLRW
jgi:hypothetical protein